MSFRNDQARNDQAQVRRDVGVVAAGRALSLLGDEVAVVALVLRASDSPNGAVMVALLLAAAMVPSLLLAPVSGLLVDRVSAKGLLVTTSLVQSVVCASLVMVEHAAGVLVLVLLLNAAQTVVGPAWQALLPSLVPADRLPSALSTMQASAAAAGMLGPAIGGLLVGLGGVEAALAVNAVSFLALTVAALLVSRDRQPGRSAHEGSVLRESVAGFSHLRREPVIGALVLLVGGFVLVLGAVNVAEVFMVTDVLGGTPLVYGLIGMLFAGGSLVGALLAPALKPADGAAGDRRLVRGVVVACISMSLGIGVVAVAPALVVVALASIVIGVSNAGLTIWVQQLLIRRTPDHLRGRVFAAFQAVANAATLVALGAGAVALAVLGPREVVGLAAVGALGVLVMLLPLLRRERPAVPDVDRRDVATASTI